MSNNFYSPHPEDDELLSYSDNELEGAPARSVRKHLKECWRCRTQLEDLQATVTGFMRYREHTLVPNLPAPPQPWKSLKGDFDRMDRENANLSARSPMFARFGPLPAMHVSRIAVGLAALAVIGFGFGYYYVLRPDVPIPADCREAAARSLRAGCIPSRDPLIVESREVAAAPDATRRQRLAPNSRLRSWSARKSKSRLPCTARRRTWASPSKWCANRIASSSPEPLYPPAAVRN